MKTVKEQQDFFDKNFMKVPDFEDIYKQFEQFEKELADKNLTESEFADYRQQLGKEFIDVHMVIINADVENIKQHEGYAPELRIIAAEQYYFDTVSLLKQVVINRDWGIDFFSLLKAYKSIFEEKVLNWYKRKIVHLVNRVNDEPTDELHQLIIKDQFKAESELLINSNNPILPFYHERLTSLMVNLDKRSAIAGGFDKAETGKWDNLYIDLTNAKYINTTAEVFNSVMEYKRPPDGAKKIQWLTFISDALYFQQKLGFTVKQLNECFQSKNGKLFTEHNRLGVPPKAPLPDIIYKK